MNIKSIPLPFVVLAFISIAQHGYTSIDHQSQVKQPKEHPTWVEVLNELDSMYEPLPPSYSTSEEYVQRQRKLSFIKFTNTVSRAVLGQNIDVIEHRLEDGQIFAVSALYKVLEDPIPDTKAEDIVKIIYGYSLEDGIVIENPDDIELIINCLKTRTLHPYHLEIVLPIESIDGSGKSCSISMVHGCTLAMRSITKRDEIITTFGHIEDNEHNPDLAALVIDAIKNERVTYVGDASPNLLSGEDEQ
jgi:hypothetical protein